jgi:ankyrin repeat protein
VPEPAQRKGGGARPPAAPDPPRLMALLHAAVEKGQSEIAKFLPYRGAHVDVESSFLTPVQIASHRGHTGTPKTLVEHNADPNKHFTQFTHGGMAFTASSVPCVELLIQVGADMCVSRFLHPLARAAEKG